MALGNVASVYADLITYTTLTPYNPGTTTSYGSGEQKMSCALMHSARHPMTSWVRSRVKVVILGCSKFYGTIGLGEIITPKTGSTYGAPNNHGLTVNSLTMPLAGRGQTVTLSIVAGQLQDGSGNPIAPNSPNSAGPPAVTATWVPSGTVYTNTFTWAAQANAVLARFDLAAANAADPVNNPAVPTLALNQSYAVELEWNWATGTDTNDVVWYRGGQVDPGGQIMAELGPGASFTGFATFATAGVGAAAPRTAALAINAPAAVPEPGTLVLLGLAVPALGWAARRRK